MRIWIPRNRMELKQQRTFFQERLLLDGSRLRILFLYCSLLIRCSDLLSLSASGFPCPLHSALTIPLVRFIPRGQNRTDKHLLHNLIHILARISNNMAGIDLWSPSLSIQVFPRSIPLYMAPLYCGAAFHFPRS